MSTLDPPVLYFQIESCPGGLRAAANGPIDQLVISDLDKLTGPTADSAGSDQGGGISRLVQGQGIAQGSSPGPMTTRQRISSGWVPPQQRQPPPQQQTYYLEVNLADMAARPLVRSSNFTKIRRMWFQGVMNATVGSLLVLTMIDPDDPNGSDWRVEPVLVS